jgi:hypothetical protein
VHIDWHLVTVAYLKTSHSNSTEEYKEMVKSLFEAMKQYIQPLKRNSSYCKYLLLYKDHLLRALCYARNEECECMPKSV